MDTCLPGKSLQSIMVSLSALQDKTDSELDEFAKDLAEIDMALGDMVEQLDG